MIMTSHGDFCYGILSSYQMIAGENPDLLAISLTEAGIQEFSSQFEKQLAALESEELLILTDIKGGTPYNEAYKYYLSNEEHVRVVAGMNLPMVIEVGMNLSNSSLGKLYEMAIEAGQQGIEGAANEEDQENDLDF
ncbi:PTS sugar transporter subunit IIA [Enterococcus pseudoavium]|uniref:PTS sugar transporter subunit IIA n=1 Tax=Enterococcus pseudoavium TaxID=44007 RepID=A0ABU3FE82_9ENTE|nr:PTS sugar transporter subunit IIA [Enterococcus pseudoavium]MDT2754598.1 PTS sugar transporter subunit IIA [Enterococcus pseudoavium]MDT2769347.1 PTS sugar transporter subunit IIA [Enterococcus pseudoavium]